MTIVCYATFSELCDGENDCNDTTDESSCAECPNSRPNACDCNKVGSNNYPCTNRSLQCYEDKRK